MQFKASQKLLNPNQQQNASKNEFEKLKEKANKLFQEKKYNEAIKTYTKLLQLSELSSENLAKIFSNRSASYFMLGSQSSLKMANSDAEEAIKLWPKWWKGYFRLGRVYAKNEEWDKAESSLNQASVLNYKSKEVQDELNFVRSKFAGYKHVAQPESSQTIEEIVIEKRIHLGMCEKEYSDANKYIDNMPGIGDIFKGHNYKRGVGVPQDYKKAAEYYLKAANLGFPEGMYCLGMLYHEGNGFKRDYKEAMKWFLKAANTEPSSTMLKNGIPEAQHALALNYMGGIGVNKDCQKAAEWYEKAVLNESIPSAVNLATLYLHGMGVEKNVLKAFNYFKFAAQSGDTVAMRNLANMYFKDIGYGPRMPTEEDVAEGYKWLNLAAEKGDLEAVEELKRREKMKSLVQTKEGFSEELKKLSIDESIIEKPDSINYEQFGKSVEEAAKRGSITAQKHLEIWENLENALLAFWKNDSAKLIAALSKAIQLNSEIVKVPILYFPLIEERIKTHPNDLDTIICYIQIDAKRVLDMKEYIPKVFKLFPDNEYLAETVGWNYLNDGNPRAALTHKYSHPNSLPLRFGRAIAIRLNQGPADEYIKALDEFLALAPEDDPDVPRCYYFKAQTYYTNRNFELFVECFEAGLAAEKKQLPCFLPYYFEGKAMLEKFYIVETRKRTSIGKNDQGHRFEQIKTDPKRKILLCQNREAFISFAEDGVITLQMCHEMTKKPPKISNPPNWSSPKKITFKDIDATKDKIYNGCILEVRIIDWGNLLDNGSISTKIEDKNGEINRFLIHKWPLTGDRNSDMLETIKTFRPNVKISIINPYNFMIKEGKNTIRVESPEFIILDPSKIDKLCHVCGKEAKILPCSACKMAFYCSKDCQKLDWIEFNHKGVCKHLKVYANLM
uniref:MYND-type domain-containing protein n=1 Tax=Panagrolaimus sp. ES5 TaxID=591445 RepID=A0AC34FC12_9BILA